MKTGIGFGAEVVSPDDRSTISTLLRDTEPDDLIRFGLIPELVGRLPVVATLDELSESALIDILVRPKNALVKQYQKMFRLETSSWRSATVRWQRSPGVRSNDALARVVCDP